MRSTASSWWSRVRSATRVAGLPTRPVGDGPSSVTSPSPTSVVTRSDTVTRVSPVARARSAREDGPPWNSRCSTIERWWARASSGNTFVVVRSVVLTFVR